MNDDPKKQWRRFEKLRSTKHVQRRLRKMESASIKHAHKFIVKRWENVREVRRHALAWLLLLAVLIGSLAAQSAVTQQAYKLPVPAETGTYSEGTLGQFDNLNPIYAITQPERSAAKLLFSGLLEYDSDGVLRNDLAVSWKVENEGKRYVITLRDNLKWDDNQPITAEDVVFTVNSIKNADARSPLYSNWRDITVSSSDDKTVIFDLPVTYAPFPHFLTLGILPKHKFEGIKASELRGAVFNRRPIGSGPFSFKDLQTINTETGRLVVHMAANPNYHGGAPKLERFQLHVYGDRDELRRAFSGGEVISLADLTAQDLQQIENLDQYEVSDIPVNNVALSIFKTDSGLLQDIAIRKALRLATDQTELINEALHGRAIAIDTPLPPALLKDSERHKQPPLNLDEADKVLNEAGWVKDATGKRIKDGQPLRLSVVTIRTGDYPKVLEVLAKQWSKLGITVDPVLADPGDIQQSIIGPRLYDVLIYELAVGGDPDVYAYWHSSQANMRGLNLANYKSGKTDDALTSARGRFEADLRDAKYQTFVQQWLEDVPAVVLYQPTFHYVSREKININTNASLVDAVDRYRNVQYWSINNVMKNQTP